MAQDQYTAVWVSHSSMGDFLRCPRAYYLKNIYKNPKTGHKISLINPPMALGGAVHEVVESLSVIKTDKRFTEPLPRKFEKAWEKIAGKRGGFKNKNQEQEYKSRGLKMLKKITTNPGPLKNLAVKINQNLPHFWLSPDDNIILCGKIDWLEYIPKTNSVHIIDFKTSTKKESKKSLQLPIYHLLVHYCQNRQVDKASYWYLELDDHPTEKKLPDLKKAKKEILKIAKQIKLARQLDRFKCAHGSGCYACRPLESAVAGKAQLVGTNEYNQDVYVVDTAKSESEASSSLL